MKKIILFLFAVAASSSLLLAQTEESITNCQLSSAGCNNQGDNLDCYPMMIPGELKEVEEGIEDIKEFFRFSEKKVCLSDMSINTTTENPLLFSNSSIVLSSAINNGKNHAEENEKMTIFEGNEIDSKDIDENQKVSEIFLKMDPWTRKLVLVEQKRKIHKAQENVRTTVGESLFFWKKAVNSLQKSVEYWEKASEVQEALVAEYCLVAEQSNQAAKQWIQAVKIIEQGKVNQWKEAGDSMQLSVDCRIKRIQARSIGDEKKAQEYLQVAEKFQKASESWVQVVKLLMDGKKQEAIIFACKEYSLQTAGMVKKYALQALDAHEEGKVALAAAYSEAAATSQCATDQLKLSAQAYSSGKIGEGDALYNAGWSLQATADYQAKAVEAQEEGKATLAVGYSEAMVTLQCATDQLKLSAQAYSLGKMREGDALHRAGQSLKEKADYEAKAVEAQEEGKATFVVAYSEAAITSQNLADQFILATKTMAVGKQDESNEQLRSATSLQLKLNYQVKAINAQEAGKTKLATGYSEAAGILQHAADQYRLSAQVMAAEKKRASISRGLDWEAYSFHVSGCYHAQACEALEDGKTALATSYSEASATSQYTADQFRLAIETMIEGKQDEGNKRLWKAESLHSKVDYQVKAIKAQEAGKVTLSAGYREAAETSQRAVDQCELSVQALFSEKRRESISRSNQSACLQSKADYQAKACEAQEDGKAILTVGYSKAAAILEKAAECCKKAAEARAVGKWLTAHGFDKLGEKINREAHAKATRAEEAAKGGISKFVSRIRSFVDFLGSVESDF